MNELSSAASPFAPSLFVDERADRVVVAKSLGRRLPPLGVSLFALFVAHLALVLRVSPACYWVWPLGAATLVALHSLGPLRAVFRLDRDGFDFEGSRPSHACAIPLRQIRAIRAVRVDGAPYVGVERADGSLSVFRCRGMTVVESEAAARLLAARLPWEPPA